MNYRPHYDHLMGSGLYDALIQKGWLVEHMERPAIHPNLSEDVYKILQPSKIEFISYPHEWSFGQLKDAALLTLQIQKLALEHGMSLKDASAYNIQFKKGRPVFIDTLSFECFEKGSTWIAYRQFCQHFLAPLALMAKVDVRTGQLFKVHLDGIPLDLASKLLSKKSYFNPGLLMHIHLHSKMQKTYSNTTKPIEDKHRKKVQITQNGLLGIITSLNHTIKKLDWTPKGTQWVEYYQATNYSEDAFEEKTRIVENYLIKARPNTVWDLGANTGHFSLLAKKTGALTIAFDIDYGAVELNYRMMKKSQKNNSENAKDDVMLLPLLLDITNPSPGIGWCNTERDSLIQRGPADCVMALALLHHLFITHNLPFIRIADFFAKICHQLIIEFVPQSDSQVQRLLQSRNGVLHNNYTKEQFEQDFGAFFTIDSVDEINTSKRTLYFMIKKQPNKE